RKSATGSAIKRVSCAVRARISTEITTRWKKYAAEGFNSSAAHFIQAASLPYRRAHSGGFVKIAVRIARRWIAVLMDTGDGRRQILQFEEIIRLTEQFV